MLQFKHFRLSFLLAALTAGFAFSGCEIEDDDDGGLGDGAIEDKDGDVSGDSSKEDAGKEDAATKECSKDDDCKNVQGVDACHVSICKADGKCSAPEAIAVKEGEICCVGDDDPVCNEGVKNTCAVGACTGTGALEGADYKVCVYTAKEDCCQNAEGGLQCADGKVCKKAPAVETKDAEDAEGGEGGETPEVIAASIDPTLDLGEASVCVQCNVDDDCKALDEFKNLNDCQSVACNANNTCEVTWASGCCFVETESTTKDDAPKTYGCEHMTGYDATATYGCYVNDEGDFTDVVDPDDSTKTITGKEKSAQLVTSGKGICGIAAELASCNDTCGKEHACLSGKDESDPATYGGATGSKLQFFPEECMINEQTNKFVCDIREYACDNASQEGQTNSCDDETQYCSLSRTKNFCKPTNGKGWKVRDSHCDDGKECYKEDGSQAAIGEPGTCAVKTEVATCKADCPATTVSCAEDGITLLTVNACKVSEGEPICNKENPVPTNCALTNQVCGEETVETPDEGPVSEIIVSYACIDPCEGKEQWASCGDPNLFCQTQTEGGMKCGAIACDIDATTINPQCPDNYHCAKEDGAENAYCVADIPVVGSCSTKGEFCASTPVQIDQFCVEEIEITEAGAQQAASLKCGTISCTGSEATSPCPSNAVCDGEKCVLKCENSMAAHLGYCAGGQTCVSSDEPTPIYGCVTEMPGKK